MKGQLNLGMQRRAAGVVQARSDAAPDISRRQRPTENLIQGLLFLCGVISIFTTIGIVIVLGREAYLFFGAPEVSLVEFFTSTVWQPAIGDFGILPLFTATITTSAIAMLVALPLGLSAAIYLSEYATPRIRGIVKPILEVLAGIPTVVYGFFALTFMTPLLQSIFGRGTVEIYNTASAGLVMGIMITPIISSMSEDALSAVPRALREGAYGLGATRFEVATRIVVPAALSGIFAAFVIGISRAIGETMIVAIAAGAGPRFTFNPFRAAETMTGHIARISGGDISYNTIDYNSIFAIGLSLFVLTLALNIIGRRIIQRFREVYD
ncbi:MAG TPA: phosphate ABC transporter permease subunit PstC [Herpetosiphonaceae bacterium]|nr:phosphate ABC transporter permease subunit PstC [Herpetosiphonaceae bacterium]